MPTSLLAKKLGIKPGNSVLIINAPEGYLDLLGELPVGATLAKSGYGPFDLVQAFVYSQADIDRLMLDATSAVKPGGHLCFAFPKKTGKIKSDISRDNGWEKLIASGWDHVMLVAIDETWSAFRFKRV